MMQGHRDLAVVAELMMDELAPLVGAQHGTFFLSEPVNGDTQLRLIAGYGLRADKTAPIQYRLGQSLIGQAARSKRSIVVAGLPEGYVKISSGLGEAPPANLAVLPILFEDQVLGVIELASFTPFTPVQTDFLEQLTETLGVNFNTIIANSRTDALLEESQRLTSELQARSEELQNQQVELQRSNAELEDKAALLAAQNRDIAPVHVVTATSPEQGIETLSAAPHQCVVLDLGLEDASAFAFLERLREEPGLHEVPVLAHTRDKLDSAQARLARLSFGSQPLELLPSLDELRERITLHLSAAQPIIAVTARAMPGDKEKSIAAGASDYVTKPVDTDELLACMERWLTHR